MIRRTFVVVALVIGCFPPFFSWWSLPFISGSFDLNIPGLIP